MISVLIPAYNCARWIEESLRSIVRQTIRVEEIIVADDASTDGTAEIVEGLGLPGVRVLRSERNLGISTQLNRMIETAKGRYLARMDGDDIALPHRLSRQLSEMDRRSVGVMGAWVRRFGESDTLHRYAAEDDRIKAGLLFSVPFCHPTVVFDRDKIAGTIRYDSRFDLAEDFHLWTILRDRVVFGNVPEVLLHWRMHKHNAGTASTTAPIQRKLSTAIRISLLEDYGIRLERKEHDALELRAMSHTLDLDQTRDYLGTLEAVSGVSEARLDAPRKELRSVVSEQWDLSCLFSAWQVRGIAAIWLEGCDRLRIPRSPQTLGKILMKRLVGRIRPR